MDLLEAMKLRHSVRAYEDKAIEGEVLKNLEDEIEACNKEGGLHIQLIKDEPKAFDSRMAHYGKFSGVKNYIAMIGKKSANLDERCGYYGERLVLLAQTLGLSTCWVAMTYKKIPEVFQIASGEKLVIVIAIGYGKTEGVAHKSKEASLISNLSANSPEWFKNGVEAALLAPTAMNQQKFKFELNDDRIISKPGVAFYTKVDLGIAKYHFEVGAGKGHLFDGMRDEK